MKYEVINTITFPIGTIVKVNDPAWEFQVVKGKNKGIKGHLANGLDGWLIENTDENRKMLNQFNKESKQLSKAIKSLNERWDKISTVKL